VIDLLLLTHLLNTCNFIPKDRFLGFLTIEIRLRKIPVVAIRMLGLDDCYALPRGGCAGVPLGRSDELGVPAAIGSFRETLDSHAQKTLAKKDDQLLELVIAKIFVSVFHEGNLRPFPNPSWSAFTVAYAIPN